MRDRTPLLKEMLIDMVIDSRPHGSPYTAFIYLTRVGLMEFSGSQWNESWGWKHSSLKSISIEGLYQLYRDLKKGDYFWEKVLEAKPVWK